MKDRPMLFSAPMVRALLGGSKTQTRRALRFQPDYPIQIATDPHTNRFQYSGREPFTLATLLRECPYGWPGDRLWVRETCWIANGATDIGGVLHCADHEGLTMGGMKKRPSIHMPRWASRILLEITSVRVERLQDCSKKDAIAEGIHQYEHFWRDCDYPLPDVAYEPVKGWPMRYSCPVQAYQALWESINGTGSWDANPWVWVVEFRLLNPAG